MHCYIYQRQHSFVHLEILMKKGMRMKVKKMKMMMRGRKERKMKEKMTNGTLMDSNLF